MEKKDNQAEAAGGQPQVAEQAPQAVRPQRADGVADGVSVWGEGVYKALQSPWGGWIAGFFLCLFSTYFAGLAGAASTLMVVAGVMFFFQKTASFTKRSG